MASIQNAVKIKTLPQLLNDMKQRLVTRYPGLNTSEESVTNQILASPAVEMAIIYEEVEKVFFSHYPLYSEGLSLDFSMQFTGNKRLAGRPQILEVLYRGDGSVLEADSRFFSPKEPNFIFASRDKLTLSDNDTFVVQTLLDIDFAIFPGDSLLPKNRIPGLQSLVVKSIVQSGVQFEPDRKLQERYFSQLSLRSLESTEAIASRVRAVAGVENVLIIQNNNDYPDTDGRPAGSVEIIVSGGNDQQVAETIEAAVSPGTILIGVPYRVQSGNVIRFSRALARPIFFLLEISIDPRIFESREEDIINAFVSRCRETFGQGDDIILSPVCLGFLSEFKGITFAVIRAGFQQNVYIASSGNSQELDLTGDGRVDENDLSIFMSSYNRASRAARKPNQLTIEKNETPTFSDTNVTLRVKFDSSSALAIPIEIRARFLVDDDFPADGDNIIKNTFIRVIDTLEVGRSVSVFQVLTPSIQTIGTYLEGDIQIRKVGDTSFSQYVVIQSNELATVTEEAIQIELRRLP